ncbi:S-layer homology domain-containing protein [Candidatus Peribacteria bacterium]|nr:S-layer homology domain-containing protein [Candidatus Peribacteria bacterium]
MKQCEFHRRFMASLALVAAANLAGGQAFAAGFPDTTGTDFETAFAYLQDKNIISGYADGYARPSSPLNRVEALKVILRARGEYDSRIAFYKNSMPPIPLFTDVDQSQWYGPYIETAFEKGVITGYPDGSFRPGQLLRTEEAVTMLMRTFGDQGETSKANLSNFIENQANEWYTPSINAAINRNLVMHKGKLKLGTAITRGQFFEMVYRLHSIKANGAVAYEGPEPDVAPQRVAAPAQRSTELYSPTGVTMLSGNNQLPPNVSVAPKIDNPYASEKYFAISMPSLGISDLTITHPEDAVSKDGVLSVLQLGVGHLFAYPGGGGKIMVYGHSSGYPWDVSQYTKIFRRINELKVGDRVYVTYAGNLYVYEVTHEQTIAASSAGDAFKDDGSGEELILFTCWPPDSISQRYLVHAVPVETIALR